MLALLDRMQEFRSSNEDDNRYNILEYIDSQGYTDFRDCPDHALATLQFAERLQDRDLWTDAFVHCAGMWEQLDESSEFEVSRCALIRLSQSYLTSIRSMFHARHRLSYLELIWKWTYDWNVLEHLWVLFWRMI